MQLKNVIYAVVLALLGPPSLCAQPPVQLDIIARDARTSERFAELYEQAQRCGGPFIFTCVETVVNGEPHYHWYLKQFMDEHISHSCYYDPLSKQQIVSMRLYEVTKYGNHFNLTKVTPHGVSISSTAQAGPVPLSPPIMPTSAPRKAPAPCRICMCLVYNTSAGLNSCMAYVFTDEDTEGGPWEECRDCVGAGAIGCLGVIGCLYCYALCGKALGVAP